MTGDRRPRPTVTWLFAALLLMSAAGPALAQATGDDPIGDLVAAQAAAEAKPKASPAPPAAPPTPAQPTQQQPPPPRAPAPPPVFLQPASPPSAADATTDEETAPGSSRSGLPPAAFFRPPPWSLDGRWVVTAGDGRALYIFQLSETGGGQIDGAWRDAARTASIHGFGVLSSVLRNGASVVIRFSDRPNAPPSELTLTLGSDGTWTGQGRLGDHTVAVIMKRL